MSIDDVESLEETLDVMSSPRLVSQIRDSLAGLANDDAEVLSKDEVLDLLRS